MEKIQSLKDPRIQEARTLNTSRGRSTVNKILVEGEQAIQWALEEGIIFMYVLVAERFNSPILRLLIDSRITLFHITEGLLKKITDTNYVIPIVGVAQYPNPKTRNEDFLVVLDGVRDFGNVGTIVRTCHAFGITNILSSKRDFDIFNRKTVSASRGKVYSVNSTSFNDPNEVVQYLRNANYQIIVASPYGDTIQSIAKLTEQPVALIVGNETNGISEEFLAIANSVVQIPMYNDIESLNVGVAAGIRIYEL